MGKSRSSVRVATWAALVFLVGSVFNPSGYGWGAYGHEQVSAVAVTLVRDTPLGKWLFRNTDTLERLSITPDCEWKANRSCKLPEDEHLKNLVFRADRYEHPLHFFEPDAFIKDGKVNLHSVASLPTGDYLDVFTRYLKLFAENIEHVLLFPRKKPIEDPAHPTSEDIEEDGTAQWRVTQLFDLAVRSLAREDYEAAILYLGTMSHYVGDLSQPFHVTMNYDGKVHTPSAEGIHAAFETKMLDRAAKEAGASKDPETKLWDSFEATEAAVLTAAKSVFGDGGTLSRKEIIPTLLKLAGRGFGQTEPLMDAFADAVQEAGSAGAEAERQFAKARIETRDDGSGVRPTVFELAEYRLGESAAILARLWLSAYESAKRQKKTISVNDAPNYAFEQTYTLEHYPIPDYLPVE